MIAHLAVLFALLIAALFALSAAISLVAGIALVWVAIRPGRAES